MDAGWIEVVALESESLSPSLGQGETDAIQLAMQDPSGTLLILDDRLARRFALRLGLNTVGTVRLLDLAEKRGLIADAGDCLSAMASRGYRISPALLARIRGED